MGRFSILYSCIIWMYLYIIYCTYEYWRKYSCMRWFFSSNGWYVWLFCICMRISSFCRWTISRLFGFSPRRSILAGKYLLCVIGFWMLFASIQEIITSKVCCVFHSRDDDWCLRLWGEHFTSRTSIICIIIFDETDPLFNRQSNERRNLFQNAWIWFWMHQKQYLRRWFAWFCVVAKGQLTYEYVYLQLVVAPSDRLLRILQCNFTWHGQQQHWGYVEAWNS